MSIMTGLKCFAPSCSTVMVEQVALVPSLRHLAAAGEQFSSVKLEDWVVCRRCAAAVNGAKKGRVGFFSLSSTRTLLARKRGRIATVGALGHRHGRERNAAAANKAAAEAARATKRVKREAAAAAALAPYAA